MSITGRSKIYRIKCKCPMCKKLYQDTSETEFTRVFYQYCQVCVMKVRFIPEQDVQKMPALGNNSTRGAVEE